MNSVDAYRPELMSLLTCPVDWKEVVRSSVGAGAEDSISYAEPVVDALQAYWCEFLRRYEVRGEAKLAKHFNIHLANPSTCDVDEYDWSAPGFLMDPRDWDSLGPDDPAELEGDLHHIRRWIPVAIKDYREFSTYLEAMRFDDPRDKHVLKGASDEQTIQGSVKDTSLFFPRYYEGQRKLFWYHMRSIWREVARGKHMLPVIDCGFAVGGCERKPTSLVRLRITPPGFHGHPILKPADLPEIEIELLDDPRPVFGDLDFQRM